MSDKRYFQTTDIELLLPMLLLGLLVSLVFPSLPARGDSLAGIRTGGMILVMGFLVLSAAKISLFRRGIWTSWGPKRMTVGWSRVYKIGYALMGVGLLITIAAYRAMH